MYLYWYPVFLPVWHHAIVALYRAAGPPKIGRYAWANPDKVWGFGPECLGAASGHELGLRGALSALRIKIRVL